MSFGPSSIRIVSVPGRSRAPAPRTHTVQGAEPVKCVHKSHGSSACDTSHPELLTMKKGATKVTMTDMYQGRSCGTCHDGSKAFRAMECAKCDKGSQREMTVQGLQTIISLTRNKSSVFLTMRQDYKYHLGGGSLLFSGLYRREVWYAV